MKKGVLLAAYLAFWAAIAASVTYAVIRAGYSMWVGVGSAFVLFQISNGTLAYRIRAHRLRQEGKTPPPHLLQYIFFPRGAATLNDEAPKSIQYLVSLAAALLGAFFVFCGVALAIDADWSRISYPILAVAICVILGSIGAAILYGAWRILAASMKTPSDVV